MLPYDSIVNPLLRAEMLLVIPFLVFGAAAIRQRHLEKTRNLTKAPVFSDRTKLGFFRSAQNFFLGMILALTGAVTLVTHEHARFSHVRYIELPLTSTADPAHSTTAPQKVR